MAGLDPTIHWLALCRRLRWSPGHSPGVNEQGKLNYPYESLYLASAVGESRLRVRLGGAQCGGQTYQSRTYGIGDRFYAVRLLLFSKVT
jgi:hypothetical protein